MTTAADRQRGLTLVETLVAMAVLGLVVAAIMALIAQSARFVSSSQDRLLAGIVADNMMVEAMAEAAPLERGALEAQADYAGLRWIARQTVTETGVDGLVRIDIAVRGADTPQTLAAVTTLKREARR